MLNGRTKISHSVPTPTLSTHAHRLNTIKCYAGLLFCLFGGGLTIVNMMAEQLRKLNPTVQPTRSLFPWQMILHYYLHWVLDRLVKLSDLLLSDGEPSGLIQQKLHMDNLMKIQVCKTMQFCMSKGVSICSRGQLLMHNTAHL